MTSNKRIVMPPFAQSNVLVYGDLMLDRYWHGDASRISPEAPVPVVNVSHTETRPGGAANVAQNIAALGGKVTLCGLVGDDPQAQDLHGCLDQAKIDCCFLSVPDYPTIAKFRVLGRHQQLIRMDFEKGHDAPVDDDALFEVYAEKIKTAQVLVLSDYSKGALCHVERLIELARKHDVSILVDPKHKNYQRYAGATMITPNLKEFELVVGRCRDLSEIIHKAETLLAQVDIESLLITLGKDGMVFVKRNQKAAHFTTKARDVFDVTGAGDTVIAVLAASLAAGSDVLSAIELANLAAGIVVGRLGAQTVSMSDLQAILTPQLESKSAVLTEKDLLLEIAQARLRGEKIVMTNGCFDVLHVGHVDYLAKAKALGDRLIVAVNDDGSVRALKGETRPLNSIAARMIVVAALGAVDWVVPFSEDTPARLVKAVMPDVLVKGGDYQVSEIAGSDTVSANGGRVLTIPLVEGFSTTGLIEKMKKEVLV